MLIEKTTDSALDLEIATAQACRQTDRQTASASGGFLLATEMMAKSIPNICGPIYNTEHRAKAWEDGVGGGERGKV